MNKILFRALLGIASTFIFCPINNIHADEMPPPPNMDVVSSTPTPNIHLKEAGSNVTEAIPSSGVNDEHYPEVTDEEIKSSLDYNFENEYRSLFPTKTQSKIGKIVLWKLYIERIDEKGNVYAENNRPTPGTAIVELQGPYTKNLKIGYTAYVKGKFVGLGDVYDPYNHFHYVILKVLALKITCLKCGQL